MKPILAELGLVTLGREEGWAVVSPDNQFRYLLGRMWDLFFSSGEEWWERSSPNARPIWVFAMLNPSRARVDDDPTITKCIGFAKRGGAGGLIVVNAMAYSTPFPKELVEAAEGGLRHGRTVPPVDVYGPHNDAAIAWALSRPAPLQRRIAAWGQVPPTLKLLSTRGLDAFLAGELRAAECLGMNADGTPKHPSRLPYSTPLVPYRRAA